MPTRAELRTVVRTDPLLASTDVVADAALNTILNWGALDLARLGDAVIVGSATWAGVASAQTYVLSGASPQITGFLDIYWPAGGLVYKPTSTATKTAPNDFQFVSESWLNLNIPGWQDATASDTLQKVYLSVDSSGYLVLGVYPKTSSTTPTFKLYFTSRGTDMSGDTHYPWTGSTTNLTHTEPYQIAIAWWAMWHLHKTKTHQDALADHYLQLYLAKAAEFKQAQRRIFAAELIGLSEEATLMAGQVFGGG